MERHPSLKAKGDLVEIWSGIAMNYRSLIPSDVRSGPRYIAMKRHHAGLALLNVTIAGNKN
jgi:hypothetical protein